MRALLVAVAVGGVAAADPCDKPGPVCECSHKPAACNELMPAGSDLRDAFISWVVDGVDPRDDEDGSIAKATADCDLGDSAACLFAGGAFLGLGKKSEGMLRMTTACTAGFSIACDAVGDDLHGCLAGSPRGCASLWRRHAVVDKKQLAAACAKHADATCTMFESSKPVLQDLCVKGEVLACLRLGDLLFATDPTRARLFYGSACAARLTDGCVQVARTYLKTDQQKAIDLLQPLCHDHIDGACAALDEATHEH
jgi:hypothetical protein